MKFGCIQISVRDLRYAFFPSPEFQKIHCKYTKSPFSIFKLEITHNNTGIQILTYFLQNKIQFTFITDYICCYSFRGRGSDGKKKPCEIWGQMNCVTQKCPFV